MILSRKEAATMSKPAKSPVSRLMAYVTRRHKAQFSFVVICILASAVASMVGTLFIQVIIDDYILKILETGEDLFAGLVAVLTVMAAVYLVGALATLFYNRVIAIVGQKVLKEIRDDLFVRMQRLPISYFDSHNHGDIMSVYTNDIDTLRQFIAQSLPMMISSIVTLVFSFAVMLHFSLPLALIVLVISVLMVVVGRLMVRYSGKYFFKQQTSVGYVNGYSEEIFGGLKVVKVFNHEDACREQMRKLNEELYENSLKANGMATVMMPIMSAFGNLEYLIVAVVGGAMALFGDGMFMTTVGTLISFLSLIRQFSSSITQTAQQMNSAVLGVAGAGRIFELMDEEPEADEGCVTLVRAREKGGELIEDENGSIWTWRQPAPRRHADLCARAWQRGLRPRGFQLRRQEDRAARHLALRQTGPEDSLRRRDRRWQDDHYEPHKPILRPRGRQDQVRRDKHHEDKKARPAPLDGHSPAGREPVHGDDHGEYPLRQARRDGRGMYCGGEALWRGQFHNEAAAGL